MEYPLYKPAGKSLPREHMMDLVHQSVRIKSGSDADSNTTSPIIAQRLTPEVIPVFVRSFPLYDLIEKVPSNGLSHTFLQNTAPTQTTDPNTISETGSVNDDQNSYLRLTTNIGVFAQRRGVTLKAAYAGANAGGPSSDLMGREITGGMTTLARDVQKEMVRYQTSDNTSTTATAVNGKYDANGFNGLRYTVANYSPPENTFSVDISSAGWTDQRVLNGVRQGCDAIWDKGGRVDLIICDSTAKRNLFLDQSSLVRYESRDTKEIAPGLVVDHITTDQGLVPVIALPGDAMGTIVTGGHTYHDMYLLDTETLELPYLGAPEPTVLRIPLGTDGTVRELAILFAMFGLACMAPEYLGRVQLKTA